MAPFRRRNRSRGRRRRRSSIAPLQRLARHFGFYTLAALLGFAAAYGWLPEREGPSGRQQEGQLVAYAPARDFPICGSARRVNCVVDGDTFWFEGERVRIADIDAPEVRGAECLEEAELADRSTRRLQALLNDGPFELRRNGSRDRDVYGRLLRTVHRDGRSLGQQLVAEGLARPWRGRSENWCG
jgi:micrococcal nuclease